MNDNKKLYILAIVAGALILLGAIFIMLFERFSGASETMRAIDYFYIGAGTVCSLAGFVCIFILIVKILKEKKII